MSLQSELTILNEIPKDLLLLEATELFTVLSGPTLIHIEGRQKSTVFVSVLLHGNEHTGWDAARRFLLENEGKELPRSLALFIGNVDAARQNQRFLEGQQDFNRMWGGRNFSAAPLMQAVIREMEKRDVFLSVDIHNNTGMNPHYACINRTDTDFLYLASLFSRTIVYFVKPEAVQSMAFSQICPSVTVECGLSGEQRGTDHALDFIHACMHLSEFPSAPAAIKDVIVYHTIAVAKISEAYSVGFSDESSDINLNGDVEYFNFRELHKGSVLGKVKPGVEAPINIVNDAGDDVSQQYIELDDGDIKIKQLLIPAMITKDIGVIRKDCFCYLMEEYSLLK